MSYVSHARGATLKIAACAILSLTAVACEKKEKVLDIKAPGVDIEVERTRKGVEIDTDRKARGERIDIKAPGADIEIEKPRD